MTPQEQTLLQNLLGKLALTPSPQIDLQADSMIRQSLGARPDAIYVLTQIVLMQNMALEQSQQQIADLQRRLGAPQPQNTSFLGGMGGGISPQPAPQATSVVPPVGGTSSGAPSFLHSVMTTAAGVVAGEAAFGALRSLLGGGGAPHAAVPTGGFWGGESPVEAPRETIINNYYGDTNPIEEDSSDLDLDGGDDFGGDSDI